MADTPSRKLAVILHADVVGSTELVRLNETIADARIQDAFSRFSDEITRHEGIAHEIRGDALVAEFSKASDAVSASLTFQDANAAHNEELADDIRPVLRIGIAMGEVVVSNNRMTGEGVVLAQRLEQLAAPYDVCIQDAAYQTVPKRLPFEFESLGEQSLKGFADPVRVFTVSLSGTKKSLANRHVSVSAENSKVRDTQMPTLAVLPFTTVGSAAEAEELADGITDVLINTVSRTGQCELSDRTSTFSYKGRSTRPVDVSKELDVQYVLQGSVQQTGEKVRVNVEVFDAEANSHVWSDRYVHTLGDVFEFQDDVARRITQSLRTVIVWGADWDVPVDNFDAWLLNIQATELSWTKGSAEHTRQGRVLFEKVMELEPSFPYGPLNCGWTYVNECIYGWTDLPEDSLSTAMMLSHRTFEIDPDDVFPFKHALLAIAHMLQGKYEEAIELADTSLRINPDEPSLMGMATGWISCMSGQFQRGRELLTRASRLLKTPNWLISDHLGTCHLLCNEHREALDMFEMSRKVIVDPTFPHALKAVTYVELGALDSAEEEMGQALEHRSGLSLEHFQYYFRFRDSALSDRFNSALLRAGLPE